MAGRVAEALGRRPVVLGVAVGALLWTLVVVAGVFPDVVRGALEPLGLTSTARSDVLGDVLLPEGLDADHLAGVAWRLLGLAVLGWVALALGASLLRLTRIARPASTPWEWLVAVCTGLAAISALMLLMAAARIMTTTGVRVLIAVLAAYAVVWSVRHRRGIGRRLAALRGLPSFLRDGVRGAERVALVCGAAVVALFTLLGLIDALGPETGFDALWYHLWLPREHLAAGTLVDRPDEYPQLYPQTVELLFGWGLAWGGEISAVLVHFGFGLLAAAAAYHLARRFTGPGWAMLAPAALLSAPTVTWELGTAYNDLPLAAFATLALIELLAWREDRDRARLVRSALLIGLGLASKHLALLMLAPLALVVLRFAWTGPGGRIRRGGRGALTAAAYTVGALLVAAPWYGRAAWLTGNPVFPELFGVFGAPADRWDAQSSRDLAAFGDTFGRGHDLPSLLALPLDVTFRADAFAASYGALFLAAVPLVVLALPTRPRGLGTVAFTAAAFGVLWASPVSSLQGRFLVPLVPLLAVLATVGIAALAGWIAGAGWRAAAAAVPVAAAVVMLLNVPPLVPLQGRVIAAGDGFAIGYVVHTSRLVDADAALTDAGAASRRRADVPGAGAVACANRVLPPGARVLTYVEGVQYLSDHPVLVYYAKAARPSQLALAEGDAGAAEAALRDLGIGWVMMGDARVSPDAGAARELLVPGMSVVCAEDGVTLYALPPAG